VTDCYVPIKVTARFAEPVITYDDGIHLDGLIAYGRLREREREGLNGDLPDPDHCDWPIDFDLPLATWEAPLSGKCHARLLNDSGKLWGWRASDIVWPDQVVEGSVALRKMTDVDQMVRHTDEGRLKQSTGILKNKDKKYPTKQAREACWYAVGDPDRVRTLLREVMHVGKLHGHGQGRVQGWEIEEIDEDWSVTKDGRLMRRMPASWCEGDGGVRRGTIRPPYWHPSRQCQCIERGQEAPDDGMG